jgi:GDP-D-mannose dehydratase
LPRFARNDSQNRHSEESQNRHSESGRHCERSEAIHDSGLHGLPRYARSDSGEVPIVRIDPRYFRPTEVETLLGDPTKAKQKLGWVPEITAQQMCAEMVAHDLAQAKQHALLKQNGYSVNVSVE